MEVFAAILELLREKQLLHSAEILEKELKTSGLTVPAGTDSELVLAAVRKALQDAQPVPRESEAVMEGLISRLVKSPKLAHSEAVDQMLAKLMGVRAFQKLASAADQLFFSAESVTPKEEDSDLPHFGHTENSQTQESKGPAKLEAAAMDDDELMAVEKVAETHQEPSSIMQGSNASFGAMLLEEETIDEYEDDDDPGYEAFECLDEDLPAVSQQLAEKYNFPHRAVLQWRPTEGKFLARDEPEVLSEETVPFRSSVLQGVRFPDSHDTFYPKEHESTIYDCFNLKVIYDREKTGFEETKDFQIVINSVVAGRYRVIEYLGSAAFSKAIQCLDEVTNEYVCMKIIENNKDYFDQSMDEIKLLKYINVNADVDEKNVLRLLDYFYHKEHLFIVTELLRDNLYEFSKYNRENEDEPYFTIGRLQRIAYQSLTALQYIHALKLIHCDLKPENILIKSYSRCQIKVIDFGSSCFIHDHLSSYVQSRSYRAPEVILGCKYDYKIDIWSLGCILAELWTGNVLFQNETVQGLLARVIGIVGGLPEEVFTSGKLVYNFFTRERLLFQEVNGTDSKSKQNEHLTDDMVELINKHRKSKNKVQVLVPKLSSLKARLRTSDLMYLDFVRCLLDTDRERRPSATEALRHPWIAECRYVDGLQ